jgi:hypothetical protein
MGGKITLIEGIILVMIGSNHFFNLGLSRHIDGSIKIELFPYLYSMAFVKKAAA